MIQGKISDAPAVCERCYKNKICTLTKYGGNAQVICGCCDHTAIMRAMSFGAAFGLVMGTVLIKKIQ